MALTDLKWSGQIICDGVQCTLDDAPDDPTVIRLIPRCRVNRVADKSEVEYIVTVRNWMTQKSSGTFDFMKKFNNDIPMPYRIMVGAKTKETAGMYYMELHADITADKMHRCIRCGRVITNPVSQYFGIGPECGGHNYIHPFSSDEELKSAVANYRKSLQEVKWSGWIAKSGIESITEK